MNRLTRRLTLLRAKRQGCFDRDQYWQETAERARVARKVRSRLRRMQPVVLLTPRWSSPRRFLDDVATDLLIGSPEVICRTLDCTQLKGLTIHQAWAWFASALAELAGLRLDGPAWQAVSRLGFQHVITQALRALQEGHNRRCLMLFALEQVPLEALEDLVAAFEAWRDEVEERDLRFTLLLAGSVTAEDVQVGGAGRPLVLQDYARREAVEALVEELGPLEPHRLEAVVDLVGGVPQLIEQIASQGDGVIGDLVARPESVWRALGPVSTQIRGAFEILASDDQMMERFEALTRSGPQPELFDVDPVLTLAGFATRIRQRHRVRVQLRAPLFEELGR